MPKANTPTEITTAEIIDKMLAGVTEQLEESMEAVAMYRLQGALKFGRQLKELRKAQGVTD